MATCVLSRTAACSFSAAAAPAAIVRTLRRSAAAQGPSRVQVMAQRPAISPRSPVVAASSGQGSQPASREADRASPAEPSTWGAVFSRFSLAATLVGSPRCLLLAWAWLSARMPLAALVWALLMGTAIKHQLALNYRQIVALQRRHKSLATIMAEQRKEYWQQTDELPLQGAFIAAMCTLWFVITSIVQMLSAAGVAQRFPAFAAPLSSEAKLVLLGALLAMAGLFLLTMWKAMRAHGVFYAAAAERRADARARRAAAHSRGQQPGMP
ncbi:hypothetical protein COHA_010775 [Chlorella ohadii]|uniref:Uncharacterized protein n=1 Tax=Chlorella ohadii TaxID=2649997 RepID=A0AAD5GWW5_9CHLO|nr:hypothetical protein COHA_010775 [Chlorella ohadii]